MGPVPFFYLTHRREDIQTKTLHMAPRFPHLSWWYYFTPLVLLVVSSVMSWAFLHLSPATHTWNQHWRWALCRRFHLSRVYGWEPAQVHRCTTHQQVRLSPALRSWGFLFSNSCTDVSSLHSDVMIWLNNPVEVIRDASVMFVNKCISISVPV